MTTQQWERVGPGRYATYWNGHSLQAIRKDGAYDPNSRPYMAVVDRVPLEKGAWSLSSAKSQAIEYVERQAGKVKAERLFGPKRNGHSNLEEVLDLKDIEPIFQPEPIPDPEPIFQPEPIPEPIPLAASAATTIDLTATVTDPDTLRALNAIVETLSLMREYAHVRCVVNLPPRLEL